MRFQLLQQMKLKDFLPSIAGILAISIWKFILYASLWLPPEVTEVIFKHIGLIFIVFTGVTLFLPFLFSLFSFKRFYSKSKIFGFISLVVVCLINYLFIGSYLYLIEINDSNIKRVFFKLDPIVNLKKYNECVKSAEFFAGGKRKYCKAGTIHGQHYAIIYDSTDNLNLPWEERNIDWKNATKDHEIEMREPSERIKDHFYYKLLSY